MEKYITRTIVSEEIGVNKPNIKLFDYAIRETGATSPYLMIGDNGRTDIYGAMKAGWYAIWMNPSGEKFPISPDEIRKDNVNPNLLFATVKDIKEMEYAIEQFFRLSFQ